MTDNSTSVVLDDFVPVINRGDDYLAAGLIFVISTAGICINLWNFSYYRRDTQSITLFILSRIFCDLIVSTMFLTYVMPVTLFALKDVYSGYWNRLSDLSSSWAYMFIVVLEPIVATNRFIAIFFPTLYERIFCKKFTIICIVSALISSSGTIMADIFGPDCVYTFDYTWLSWGYPSTPCGDASEAYGFLIPAYICNGLTFAINLIVCLRLVMLNCLWSNTITRNKRQNAHIRFFIQTCLQFFVFLIDLWVNTFLAEPDSRLVTFVYYTLIWMSLHTIDGFIIYVFRSKSLKSRVDRRSVRSHGGSSVSQMIAKY